jgi:DnaK suppressor protein
MAINDALKRIEDGTYGICANCGKPIGEERLAAIPWATHCIDCKRLEERG